MPPVFQLLIGLVVIVLLALAVRRLSLWNAERKLREPLSKKLDWLLQQVMDVERTPLDDLEVQSGSPHPGPDSPKDVSFHYFVKPRRSHHLSFSSVGIGNKVRYRVGRWDENVHAPSFPPWGVGQCRSAWFVERMEQLCKLLDAYPHERTQSSRAERVMDGQPDPFPRPSSGLT